MMLEGKRVLITGGATGIGAAISRIFHTNGACVVIASNQPQEELEKFCSGFASSPGEVMGFSCDLASPAEIEALVSRVSSTCGTIDILVNCAGLFARAAIEGMSTEAIQAIIAVNLVAPMLLTRAVIPEMRRQGRGNILNIASVGALMTVEHTAVYGATKAGLAQFTKVIAGGLGGSGIRINAIAPGSVRTGMIGFADEDMIAEKRAELDKRSSLSRSPYGQAMLEPSQVADIALFLVSDTSSAIHGSLIVADQGWSSVMPS
ncbi:Enoyl-(Acyl carrier protein) reductase [Sphingobium faniae]|nr:Enoyl-(Acyl carrier protein) reductase [Sphingobium faniae]